jgi:vacuolar protein sorting-associated protein 13A/C
MLKGTVSGLTGLITKPLTGFIFAASKTIEGINSSTTYLDYKILERQELITRPLYHKFKLVRPYKSEDELAYNILINWYDYSDV